MAESKSIQTSLQNLVLMHQRSVGQSRPGSSVTNPIHPMRDQSVQMTLEEPPETPTEKQKSMIKEVDTFRDEGQEHHHFVSHSSVHSNQQLNHESEQSVQSLHSALAVEPIPEAKQDQFEQLKIKYQKKFMQEYTSMV